MIKSSIKVIVVCAFFVCGFTQVLAQNTAAEAKAAYLLAEEEFNAGKYESAIEYLNQASEKLGAANAKILYLKIMALKALAEKNEKITLQLKETIADFEKAPDVASFNEEKMLEVLKLKMQVAKYKPVSAQEDNVYKLMFTGAYAYYYGKLKVGMPVEKLEEMFQQVPDWLRIIQAEAAKDSGLVDMYYFKIGLKKRAISALSSGVASLSHKNEKDTSATTGSELVNQFVTGFGGVPEIFESRRSFEKEGSFLRGGGGIKKFNTENVEIIRTYTWIKDDIKIVLKHTVLQKVSYHKRPPGFTSDSIAWITVSQL